MIEIYLLEQFYAFYKYKTLSSAAEHLHLSQPSLSRSMRKLEDIFGVPLFERQKNRMQLNETGILAAKYAKEVGATVIVLVGEKECPLTEYADYVFENRTASNDNLVEEIYIQYFALGARFMKNNGEFPEYEKFIDALKQMPEVLQKVREDNDERALAFAEKHKDTKFHMCVGAGNTWGETYCFAMCVLEEMQWIATKSIHAAEFFHGTVEMTEKDMSFMLFKGEDETRPLLDRVEKFVRKYSDVVQVWDTKDYELKGVDPSVRGLVSPLVMAAQLERVSAHFEHVRNHSLEIRRYYRTVEY